MNTNELDNTWLYPPRISDLQAEGDRIKEWQKWLVSQIPTTEKHVGKASFLFDETDQEDIISQQEKWTQNQLPRYIIWNDKDEILGSGGMGEVFPGFDFHNRKPIAAKLVYNKKLEEFSKKTKTIDVANLTHLLGRYQDHIPTVYSLVSDSNQFPEHTIMIMEKIEGKHPQKYLEQNPTNMALSIISIIQQMGYISTDIAKLKIREISNPDQKEYLHLDLKPENYLVDDAGKVFLMDFDLAAIHLSDDKLSTFTPRYTSPERIKKFSYTESSEVFSLAIIFYELLTKGEHPFSNINIENGKYKPISKYLIPCFKHQKLNQRLEKIFRATLAKDPTKRTQHIDSLTNEIVSILNQINRYKL